MSTDTLTQDPNVPDHVPHELVVDFNHYAPPGLQDGVHEAWQKLHAAGVPDLVWSRANGGHWIPTRAAVLADFYNNHEVFSSNITHIPRERSSGNHPIPSTIDPPIHGRYRTIINPTLSPKAVRGIEPAIRSLSISLIEAMMENGAQRGDFVEQFASILPLQIFMDYADLPKEDLPRLVEVVQERIRPSGRMTAGETLNFFRDYLRPYIIERRGGPGEDVVTRALKPKEGLEPLNMEEAELLCANLLIAGLDTVASMLGFSFLYLAKSPDLRGRIAADRTLIPRLVEELLRRHGIVSLGRVMKQDYVYNGVQMKAGDMVLLPTALASLDERVYPNPMEIDLDRPRQETVTPFGMGVHRCPGSQLARVELRVVLEEWFARIPDFGLDPSDTVEFRSGIVGSVNKLPLRWPAP